MQPVFPNNEEDPWSAAPAHAAISFQPVQPGPAAAQPHVPAISISTGPGMHQYGQSVPQAQLSPSSVGVDIGVHGAAAAPSGGAGNNTASQLGQSMLGSLGSPANQAIASVGLQYGQQFMQANVAKVSSWVNVDKVRYYFYVSNGYVLNKLKIVLFPFLNKKWEREPSDADPSSLEARLQSAYKPPARDLNAPDLYIPTMALITFVLLMGFTHGTAGKFTPEVLGMTASSSLALLLVELVIMKTCFAMSSLTSPPILDLVAFCTYKYVGAIVDIIIGLTFGRLLFWVATFLFGSLSALFMARTLRVATQPNVVESTQAYLKSSGRRTLLLFLGFLQLLFVCFLVRTAIPAAPAATVALSGTAPLSS